MQFDAASPAGPVQLITANSDSSIDPASTGGITKESVDSRIEAIQANSDLDDATKAELLKRYKAAQEWLKNSNDAVRKAAEYQAEIHNAPSALDAAKRQLAESKNEIAILVPDNATLADVERFNSDTQIAFKAAQEAFVRRDDIVQHRAERKIEIAKLTEEAKQRIDETQKQVALPPPPGEPEPLSDARRVELETRLLAYENQYALYKIEAVRHDARAELVTVNRDLAKREKKTLEVAVAQWQQIVANYRKRESDKQAAETRRQLRDAHPAFRSLAERNAKLAEQRQLLAKSMASVDQDLSTVQKQVEDLGRQFEKAEKRVQRAGHSSTVGLMLRRQREELPLKADCEAQLKKIETEMPRANLALMEIEEEREGLGDVDATVNQIIASVTDVGNHSHTELTQAAIDLVQTKLLLLTSLDNDYETYLEDLSELEVSNRKLIVGIDHSLNYIGEHVLWIRSDDALGLNDVKDAAKGLAFLAAPEHWISLTKHCGVDALRRPLFAFIVFVVVSTIVLFQSRLRANVASRCATKTGMTLHFRPTIVAVLLTAVIATEWPLLLAYLGWSIASADSSFGLAAALGTALQYAAILLWTSDFFLQILRSEGICESHFGWSTSSTKLLRSEIRWIKALGIPLAVVVFMAEHLRDAEWAGSLSRVAFVGGMLLLANFVHSILNAKENILREVIARDTGVWFERLRMYTHLVGTAVPCILAALASAGYYYSAQQVVFRWQLTLGVALIFLLIYSIAARWCLVKRRNLALQQARERQRQLAEQSTAAASDAASPLIGVQTDDQQPDLSAIHEQLRYLMRHALTVGMFVAMWFIWADVLPALKIFDRVVIWQTIEQVETTFETADGKLERNTEDLPVQTTLRHALFAVLMVTATIIIGRNLPALLTVTVLARLPFDNGGRHAISVLLNYTVALFGMFFACRTMNITWSSVQWLAAGMTVGLGFGLQEIFANFVSGLILLFERPIRVGDVITLGDVTGTVTNMRIRATTLTNWDRKELIVPNKDLITGRLLNWTLSDTTNRILIKVGVAYQSDPHVARKLILDTVSSHEEVLAEPQPSVTLEEFGDSSLNLVVRAFISSMENRLATIHDLHASIHASLAKAGIEIAFPQRDLHVRGIEQLLGDKPIDMRRDAA